MAFNFFTWLLLGLLVLHHGVETALVGLQIRHLKRRGDRVPSHLAGKVDPETIRRAVRYNLDKLRAGLVFRFWDVGVLAVMIVAGFAALDSLCRSLQGGPVVTGLLFFALLGAGAAVLSLPADIWFTFVVEKRWGFNRRTWRAFVSDQLKMLCVSAVTGGLLLAMLLWIMVTTPLFWIWGFVAVALFQLLMLWLYPLVIMPMFNRFVPVSGEVASAIGDMAVRAGFPLKDVVKMDGSKRSAHGNAFIVGLKGARRIVLFDTLMDRLSMKQLAAVVSHELGHYRLGHVRRRLLAALLVGAAAAGAFGLLADQPALLLGLGFPQDSPHALIVAVSLLLSEVGVLLGAPARWMSRRDEYAADRFAVSVTGNGTDLKDALVALTKQNLTSPGSHPWYRAYYNSHPSLRERMNAIDRLRPEEPATQ